MPGLIPMFKLLSYAVILCDCILEKTGFGGNAIYSTAPKSFVYTHFVNATKKGRTVFEDVLYYLRGAEIIEAGGVSELTLNKKKYCEFLKNNQEVKSKFEKSLMVKQ